MTDAAELIARLEQLTGPSREADVAIWNAFNPFVPAPNNPASMWPQDAIDKALRDGHDLNAPRYTASFDAALTLVPEGWYLFELRNVAPGRWYAAMCPENFYGDEKQWSADGNSAALALCIAALKARAQVKEAGRELRELKGEQYAN